MRHKMNQAETIFLHSVLSKVCKTKRGFAAYADGESDESVARTANTSYMDEAQKKRPGWAPFEFTSEHVARLRVAIYGRFEGRVNRAERFQSNDIEGLTSRIRGLEQTVHTLSAQVRELCNQKAEVNDSKNKKLMEATPLFNYGQ